MEGPGPILFTILLCRAPLALWGTTTAQTIARRIIIYWMNNGWKMDSMNWKENGKEMERKWIDRPEERR